VTLAPYLLEWARHADEQQMRPQFGNLGDDVNMLLRAEIAVAPAHDAQPRMGRAAVVD
jgi:hypothetical protein